MIEAARATGLELIGVQADKPEQLTPPFIAYVNGNHFILVVEVRDDSVIVVGMDKPEAAFTRTEFASMWDGKALTAEGTATLASVLADKTLKGAKGGTQQYLPEEGNSRPDNEDPPTTCPNPFGDGSPSPGLPGQDSCPCNNDCEEKKPSIETCPPNPNCSHPTPGFGCSPQAWAGVNVDGVNPYIDMFRMGLVIQERDLNMPATGPFSLGFTRTYRSANGNNDPLDTGWNLDFSVPYASADVTVELDTTPYWVSGHWDYTKNPPVWVPGYWTYYHETELTLAVTYVNGQTKTYQWWQGSYDYFDSDHPLEGADIADIMGLRAMCGSPYQWVDRNDTRWILEEAEGQVTNGYGSDTLKLGWVEDLASKTTIQISEYGADVTVSPPGSDSRTMTFARDGSGKISTVTLADGGNTRTVAYTYNGDGELSTVSHDGGATSVKYDYYDYSPGGSKITKITDKAGVSTYFDWYYNAGGVCTKIAVSLPNGLVTTYERSLSTGCCVAKNWDGQTMLSRHDNWPISTSVHVSNRKDYYYDASQYERWDYYFKNASTGKLLTKVTGPGGVVVSNYGYDVYDRLRSTQTAYGPITWYGYSAQSTYYPTDITGPDGLVTNYYLDGTDGLVTKITHPSLGEDGYQFAYDQYGNVTASTSPGGATTTYAYDSRGNVTSVTDPNTNQTTMTYDSWGALLSVTDPNSHTTSYEYAAGGCGGCGGGGGRLTKIADAEDNETSFEYDVNGNMIGVTDALGRDTEYEYDEMGRMTLVTVDPSGDPVTMAYAYDLLGWRITTSDFSGKTVTYAYDQLGKMTATTDAIGTVGYTYTYLVLCKS